MHTQALYSTMQTQALYKYYYAHTRVNVQKRRFIQPGQLDPLSCSQGSLQVYPLPLLRFRVIGIHYLLKVP